MTTSDVDAWELAGFPGRVNVAAYLIATNSGSIDALPMRYCSDGA